MSKLTNRGGCVSTQGSRLYNRCLFDVMPKLPAGSVDMLITDLPYGVTRNKWDTPIDLERMWSLLNRVVKPNGALVFNSAQPFTSTLVLSNPKMFRYSWVWDKTRPTGFLNAKKQPLRCHEDVCVFYRKQPNYQPIKTTNHKLSVSSRKNSDVTGNYGKFKGTEYASTERYPRSVQKWGMTETERGAHPTQKPLSMFEYLIKTYTRPGETVLDICAGSGTAAVAALNTNRKYIVIERDTEYFCTMLKRVSDVYFS